MSMWMNVHMPYGIKARICPSMGTEKQASHTLQFLGCVKMPMLYRKNGM